MNDNKNQPKSVDEAVNILLAELDEEVLNKVRDSELLVEFHFDLGMYIRNKFVHMSENKKELLEDVISRFDYPKSDIRYYLSQHDDNVSHVILVALQKRLREDARRD